MEPTCEEPTSEESARRGARPIGRPGSQRGQEAGQQTKWSQGRPGQKPQEGYCCQTKRAPAKTRAPQERVSAAISSIRARFGKYAIGFGDLGIRYGRVRAESISLVQDVPGEKRIPEGIEILISSCSG
jgi:hypothetical protein